MTKRLLLMHVSPLHNTHIAAESGTLLVDGGLSALLKVTSQLTQGAVALVEHRLGPGVIGAPPHRHQHEDEISYVLAGTLTVQIDNQIVAVQPGELVVKPRGRFHTFWNAGSEPVRFLEIIAPGGFEQYFRELGELLGASTPPAMEAIVALAQRYGLEFDFGQMEQLMQTYNLLLP